MFSIETSVPCRFAINFDASAPEMLLKFLKELGFPEDTTALALSARKWFSRIDLDCSGGIEHDELVQEFFRIGLKAAEVQQIFRFHTQIFHATTSLDMDAFILILLHVLGNSNPSLTAAEMVMLGHLFNKVITIQSFFPFLLLQPNSTDSDVHMPVAAARQEYGWLSPI